MSEESKEFLRTLVESTQTLGPIEMMDRHRQAIEDVLAGRGHIALSDGIPAGGSVWKPRINWSETLHRGVLFVDVRGLSEDNVEVLADDGHIQIRLKRTRELVLEDGQLLRSPERFDHSVTPSQPFDSEAVEATVKDGILTLVVPYHDEALQEVNVVWD